MLIKLTQLSGLPVVLEIKAFGQEEYLDWTDINLEGEPTKTIETFVEGTSGSGRYHVKEAYWLIEAFMAAYNQILTPDFDDEVGLLMRQVPGKPFKGS